MYLSEAIPCCSIIPATQMSHFETVCWFYLSQNLKIKKIICGTLSLTTNDTNLTISINSLWGHGIAASL